MTASLTSAALLLANSEEDMCATNGEDFNDFDRVRGVIGFSSGSSWGSVVVVVIVVVVVVVVVAVVVVTMEVVGW